MIRMPLFPTKRLVRSRNLHRPIHTSAARAVSGLLVAASILVASGRDAAAAEAVRLTVPYVKQTKILCGGAAAAMVFRYWGDAHADANQFAPLLDRDAGGLATGVLANAIEDRGWRVVRFTGSIESIADLLRDGRPVIVLLKVWNGRFHYVVVVGTTDTHIVIHDPARGPSRSVPVRKFLGAWEPTGFWALLVLPGQPRS
jgi:ABC-type bacteriocin/lantibiotic exporter with double-glycine peptidase domain